MAIPANSLFAFNVSSTGTVTDLTGMVTSGTISNAITIGGSGICITGASTGFLDANVWSPVQTACQTEGHEMGDEAEGAGGLITGTCTVCGETIRGRRIPGGFGLARIRQAVLGMLDSTDVTEDILALALAVKDEEAALREARALLRTASAMVASRRLK